MYIDSVPKVKYLPLTLNIKTSTPSHEISSVTILIICVYALNSNKHAKLYFPSTF